MGCSLYSTVAGSLRELQDCRTAGPQMQIMSRQAGQGGGSGVVYQG